MLRDLGSLPCANVEHEPRVIYTAREYAAAFLLDELQGVAVGDDILALASFQHTDNTGAW